MADIRSTNHCPLSIIFASSNHLAALLKLAPKCPSLRVIVSMDPLLHGEKDVLTQWASSVNVELLDMLELEKWGSTEGIRCDPGPVKGVPGEHELDRDRIVTISYTSGTTGMSLRFSYFRPSLANGIRVHRESQRCSTDE
jgi:long-chain acyl-CoA synthetase